jgi:hypothetical protein
MMLTRTSALFTLLLPGLVLGLAGCKGDESQPIGAGGNASGALSGAGGEGMAGDSGMGGANDPALPRHGSTVVLDASALVEDTSAAVFEDELVPPSMDATPVQQVVGPGANWTPQEYCAARIEGERVWCEYVEACCTVADLESLFFIPPACANGIPTEQDCLLEMMDLEAAGMVFDGTWAEACLNFEEGHTAWPPDTCAGVDLHNTFYNRRTTPSRFQIEACRRMNRGTKALGMPCDYRSECQIGLACISAPAGSANNYECQRPRRATEVCSSTADCERGLFCVSDEFISTCGTLHEEGEPCAGARDCVNGLQCVAGECQEPLYVNDPCSATEQCEVHLVCENSLCVPAEALVCDGI